MNILITGKKQSGKSTLARNIIEKFKFSIGGYVTLPLIENCNIVGYEMVKLPDKENRQTIITIDSDGKGQPNPSVFLTFGKDCVMDSLCCDYDFLLFDEIGRIERNTSVFISAINKALDSDENVLAVLKKEDIPFINEIKKRKDVKLWDIDLIDREKAFFEIVEYIEREL